MLSPKTKWLHEELTFESPHSEYSEIFISTCNLYYDYMCIVDYVRHWRRQSDNILKTERVVSLKIISHAASFISDHFIVLFKNKH